MPKRNHTWASFCVLALFLLAVFLPSAAQAQAREGEVVLQEAPLALEAPGFYRFVTAYYDGESFYVDVVDLFELLGFDVKHVPPVVEALDASRKYTLDFASGQVERTTSPTVTISLEGEYIAGAGRYYVTTSGLASIFEEDVYFEEDRLSLRLSTAADRFDVGSLRKHPRLLSQAPGPLRFGRDRRLFGGLIANYQLMRHQVADQPGLYQGSVTLTGSLLGGSVSGNLGVLRRGAGLRQADVTVPALSYLFDRPGSRILTRIEIGRFGQSYWEVPESFEGMRLSNLPLTSRYLQRETQFSGQAEPHALVEALISGVVVDRAQADQQGRYRLSVPAFYGSTEARLRVTPLGGAAQREERRYLFATNELAEPGRLYYDAYVGRSRFSHQPFSVVHVHYGLLPTLTARAAGIYYDGAVRPRLGLAFNPLSFSVLSADVDLPLRKVRGDLKVWRNAVSFEAAFERERRPSLFSTNKQQFQSQLSASWSRFSAFLSVSDTRGFQGWKHQRIGPALSFYSKGGITAAVEVAAQRLTTAGSDAGSVFTEYDGYTYRAAVGKTFFIPSGSSRLGLFARGGDVKAVGQSGVEGFLSWKSVSLGFNAGYNFVQEDFVGGVTLRMDSPWSGFSSRGTYSGDTFAHEETVYGSLEMGRKPRLTRNVLQRSSAVIRVFEDLDGDGRYQSGEPVVPHVEVQLFQAGTRRQRDGTLRAEFLQPYTVYQLQILEGTIRDPLMTPATGYTFSFIADPGRTKVIDIPLQRMPMVTGTVRGMTISPSRLRLLVFQGNEQVEAADLYRDGGFTLLLPPGRYDLRLVDVLGKHTFDSVARSIVVETGRPELLVIDLRIDRPDASPTSPVKKLRDRP